MELRRRETPRGFINVDQIRPRHIVQFDLCNFRGVGKVVGRFRQNIQRQQNLPPGEGRPVKNGLAEDDAGKDDQQPGGSPRRG